MPPGSHAENLMKETREAPGSTPARGQNSVLPRWMIPFWAALCLSGGIMAVTVQGFHLFDRGSTREPFVQGADDTFYWLWLRSAVVDGDWDFANDLRMTPFIEEHARSIALSLPPTATGKVHNKFAIGWAVVNAPLYWIAHRIAPYTPWPADGFSPPYQLAIWLQQMAYGLLGAWLAIDLMSRWMPRQTALLAMLMTWVTSPMLYYQSARVTMVHHTLWVLAVLCVWLAHRFADAMREGQPAPRRLLLVAAAAFSAGLMVSCRPSAITYLPWPIATILAAWFRHGTKDLRFLTAMSGIACLAALTGLFPQLLAWKSLHGSWLYYSYHGEGFNWFHPRWAASLISDHHGLFNWHPMLAIGLGSLLLASLPGRFPRSWVLTLLGISWMNAAWHMVHFGSAFGGRAYEWLSFFSMLGLGLLLEKSRRLPVLKNSLLVLYTAFALWNILLLYTFMRGYIPREDPVSWQQRAQAILSLPDGEKAPKPSR
jgi:hypothetical protein